MWSSGSTLLVAATDHDASLLRWDVGATGGGQPFGPRALGALRNAHLALPRTAPVLGGALADPVSPRGVEIWTRALAGRAASPKASWDGESFGLGFYLALASRAFGIPCPQDLVATATIDAFGKIGAVDRIEAKLSLLGETWGRTGVPAVNRVLVSSQQSGDMEIARRNGIEVIAVRSASEALTKVFGDGLVERLFPADADEQTRRRIIQDYFRLALNHRTGVVIDWAPFARGADLAAQRWGPSLPPDLRDRLGFSAAIALRHAENKPSRWLPDPAWIHTLPGTQKLEAAAHFVQQVTDTGAPDQTLIMELPQTLLGDPGEDGPEHLKLRGAWGRLLMLLGEGNARRALAIEEQACLGWLARMCEAEASHPLSTWFLLAAALRDGAAFDRAEHALLQIDESGRLDGLGRAFVLLARARAAIELGRSPGDALETLARADDLPDHVHFSAMRLLRRMSPKAAAAVEPKAERRHFADVFHALEILDRAVATEDAAGVPAALRAIEGTGGEMKAVAGHLLKAAPEDLLARASFVARFFPY